jgi:hypothetical protein
LLAELLQPVGGKVETQREISGETYCADVSVEPSPTAPVAAFQQLGLLGQMVKHACLVEYFWTPPTQGEIRTSLLKLFEVHNDLYRQANRDKAIPEKKSLHDDELPQLWILTTSASETLLNACGANCQPRSWGPGVYFLAKVLKTQVVVINQLPATPDTLRLRILGRGTTQRQAVTELLALAEADPSYYQLLELLSRWGVYMQTQTNLTLEEKELLMNLDVAYQKWKETTLQQGRQEGRQEGQRIFLEQLLKMRFGVSDESLIQPLLKLSPSESLGLILQRSRDELLAKFS